jgi:mannose-6-phosphate isomerase-like protein (cupin superfamily)
MYHANIVYATNENEDFRRVLHTGSLTQLVAMSIPNGGEIGLETHTHVEQVFFILRGHAEAIVDGVSRKLEAGDVLVVPPRAGHNIINTGKVDLKIYTLYAPPNHLPERIHHTKADADSDIEDEIYGHATHNGIAVSFSNGHTADIAPGYLPDFEPHPVPASPLENPDTPTIPIYDCLGL